MQIFMFHLLNYKDIYYHFIMIEILIRRLIMCKHIDYLHRIIFLHCYQWF